MSYQATRSCSVYLKAGKYIICHMIQTSFLAKKSRNVSVVDAIATIFVLFCHIIQTCLLLGHCVSSWCHCRRRCRHQNGGGGDFPNLFLPSPRSASSWFFIFFCISHRHCQHVCNFVSAIAITIASVFATESIVQKQTWPSDCFDVIVIIKINHDGWRMI